MSGSDETTSLNYPNLAPDETVRQPYLLVLHDVFSANYDERGNLYGLHHLLGYITSLEAHVAGDESGNSIYLDDTDCYSGTKHQGVAGPGAPSGNWVVRPAFTIADGAFDYQYDGVQAQINEPSGGSAC